MKREPMHCPPLVCLVAASVGCSGSSGSSGPLCKGGLRLPLHYEPGIELPEHPEYRQGTELGSVRGWWGFVMILRDCSLYIVEVCALNEEAAEIRAREIARSRYGKAERGAEAALMGVVVDSTCEVGHVGDEQG